MSYNDMLAQLKSAAKRLLGQEIATRTTDPDFYGALSYLPNPDPILMKIGQREQVYESIFYDAHVLGELRSVRAGLLSYEWRLQAGGDDSADKQALELCEKFFKGKPSKDMLWPDTLWNINKAVFKGYQVHEVVWQPFDRYLLPAKIIDKPQRRFVFSPDNEPRLITRNNRIEGEALEPYKWLLTRHMPDYDNPYGVALFSACFWPYTFKSGGLKFFYKFCEKYGIPWAIGKYPSGTPDAEIDALADGLARMVEDAVAAIPDSGKVELIQTSVSGELVQERLVNLCNREMSKALTSQTLATEIQGQGSRAAAQTHSDREHRVNDADRYVIEATMNQLLAWITEINFAEAKAPTFEFYEEAEARKEWVDVLDGVRQFLPVPARFAYERLQIPEPADGEPVLPMGDSAVPAQFSRHCPHCHDFSDQTARANNDPSPVPAMTEQVAGEAAPAIKSLLDTLRAKAENADSLEALRDELINGYGDLDSQELERVMGFAFAAAELSGRFDVNEES